MRKILEAVAAKVITPEQAEWLLSDVKDIDVPNIEMPLDKMMRECYGLHPEVSPAGEVVDYYGTVGFVCTIDTNSCSLIRQINGYAIDDTLEANCIKYGLL
jgi:hypothetical protein